MDKQSKLMKLLKMSAENNFKDNKVLIKSLGGKCKLAHATDYNTWENVSDYRDIIQGEIEYPTIHGLEEAWEELTQLYGTIGDYKDDDNETQLVNRNDKVGKTPLDAFLYYVDCGLYPPPEILLALKSCFDTYIHLKGSVELEEIFFGARKKGVGNKSAREANHSIFESMYFIEVTEELKSEKNKTQKPPLAKIAESAISRHNPLAQKYGLEHELDIDSFLRSYRRWKKRKIEEDN